MQTLIIAHVFPFRHGTIACIRRPGTNSLSYIFMFYTRFFHERDTQKKNVGIRLLHDTLIVERYKVDIIITDIN